MADKNFRVKHGINIDTQRLVDVNKNIDVGVTTSAHLRVTGVTTVGIISAVTNNARMGIVTFQSIVAIESGAQTITIAPPSQTAGFVSSYTLTLPNKIGTDGQVLALGKNGLLGFTTAGLYENRFYVSSANGDDTNDGRSKPVKSLKRAAQLASFRSFQIPGGRYLDAGNLLQSNKEFIKEEVVAYVEFNYTGITSSISYDRIKCKRDVGYIVDAISYDISYGGNSKSIEAGTAYWNAGASYIANETEQTIFAYNYVKFLGQYVINNQTPPTLYQTSVGQVFDFEVIQDPLNVGQNRYRDARNLILGNKQELIDRSLASVAVGYPDGFYFPGDTETNVRSRYYDSYGLIQRNKQEIVDKSLASIAIAYPDFYFPGDPQTTNRSRYYDSYRLIQQNRQTIVDYAYSGIATAYPAFVNPNPDKCKRDIGYFVDAVSTDVFTGGNNYSRTFTTFYFNGVGIGSLAGEEQQTIYAFRYAGQLMNQALTNQLPVKDLTLTVDPITGSNTSSASCANVQSTVSSLVGIVTAAIGVGTTSSLPTENLGYYNLSVGIGSTVTAGGTKCARDLGYFVDAISLDTFTGGNNYSRNFVFQYVNAGITNSLSGEEPQSIYAFRSAGDYMKKAITNQLNNQVLSITADPVTGFNTSPSSCSNVQSTISTLVGIVTTIVGSGSTAGITTANLGYFVVNSTDNVGSNVGVGSTNVKGGRKCARDLGYIIDAVAQDINYGTNQHIIYATKKYFDGAGVALTTGLFGEEVQSVLAFNTLRDFSKKAINNQLYYRDLTILADPVTGVNTDPSNCANVQSEIGTLVGILTGAILTGNLSSIPAENLGTADCADVRTALASNVGVITSIIGIGTTANIILNLPSTRSKPIAIFVEAGEYEEDNPILLYEDVAVVGDNLRNTIIRPSNAGVDLFRVRNGCYVTNFAMKDNIDQAGIPKFTFNYAVAFDDPADSSVSRVGYAVKTTQPIISRSPYIQNCSILSFLGANGILVDGSKVQVPNTTIIPEESELPISGAQPEFGKSMVAATFTMVSFGGIGWRTINDGYAQVVSCFQIFCKYGSLTQSGGYLSITNSATNFGLYALRSTGYSRNSFVFDRGRIVATGTNGGYQTLTTVGLGRSDQNLYVMRFINPAGSDTTSAFKPIVTRQEFTPNVGVNTSTDIITIVAHPFQNGDTVVYEGDENSSPARVIDGLISNNQYYIGYIDSDNVQLYEDSTLTRAVDLKSAPTGINTISKGNQEFIVREILDGHNVYQQLTLDIPSGTPQFTAGREITQSVAGGTAVGYAVTCVGIGTTQAKLLVSVESSGLLRRNFAVTGVGGAGQIIDHAAPIPVGWGVTASVGISTYWTILYTVDSTIPGNTVTGIGSLPIVYRVNFNRPSIINANSHAWEYSGSGIDYNALPQNGGKTVPSSEQVNEQGGRVFSTGTNELGDFKIGSFITAYNRTGNIIFNNKVTIGQLDSLRLSLSGGIVIEEFSTDPTLGDNEQGGAKNQRVSTQLAVRSFLNDRLGDFIDKNVSANAVPSAIVQLNNSGQINPDLIPPKAVSYYTTNVALGRTEFVNRIPAVNLIAGDTVVEPSAGYILTNDLRGQFLVLSSSTANYNFPPGHRVSSTNSQGAATGIVTTPTSVGYGSTGLVKGVLQTVTISNAGSGYLSAGIYTGVSLDTTTGIGTSAAATITVGAAGSVTRVDVSFGGRGFAVNDTLTVRNPVRIGGRTGGADFSVIVQTVQTRLYLALDGSLKFTGSTVIPDYIADASSVGVGTSLQSQYIHTFFPTDISVGGEVDFANDRIIVGLGTTIADGDPLYYQTVGNVIGGLVNTSTYFAKRVGLSSIELHVNYGLNEKLDLSSSGTNLHYLTRAGVSSATDRIVFLNHGFSAGDAVQVTGKTPLGITTNSFYYLGAITQNSFAFYESRDLAVSAVGGVLSTPVGIVSTENGTIILTEQNVAYNSQVNTSSNNPENWTVLASNIIDASNITSGTVSPSRLGGGNANSDTFLRGDSVYTRVVTSVGIGTTEPFTFSASFQESPAGGVGITTNYGKFTLAINRVATSQDLYSTLGVARFKSSTFSIGSDGTVQIKNSATGDVDATTLGGQPGVYYLDPVNFTSSIPVSKGGTGLAALPPLGALLQGNGVSYDLVTAPTIGGNITLTNNGRLIAVGAALTNTTISGIATIANSELTNSRILGIATFTASTNNIQQTAGTAALFRLTVSGISTLGSVQAVDVTATTITNNGTLNVNNVSQTGIVTLSGSGNNFNAVAGTQVFNRAVFSGITTFLDQVNVGVANYQTATINGTLTAGNASISGVTTISGSNNALQIPNGTATIKNVNITGFTTVTNLLFTAITATSNATATIPYLTLTNSNVSGIVTLTSTGNNINQTNGTAVINRLTVAGVSTFSNTLNYTTLQGTTANVTGTSGLTNVSVSGVATFSGSANSINQTSGTAALNRLTVTGISTFTGQINAGTIAASSLSGTLNNKLTISGPLTGTEYNNSTAVTIGINATSSNNANFVVQRGASGEFAAGAVTATGLTLNGGGSASSAQLTFSGSTNNWVDFNTTGVAAPTFTNRSSGTKVVYYRGISASSVDYAVGIEGSTLWQSVPTGAERFRWYGGQVAAATLDGSGNMTFVGVTTASRFVSNVAQGTAPVSVASTTLATNLNAQYLGGSEASSQNLGNYVVKRDTLGGFVAGIITATTLRGSLGNTLTAGSYLTGTSYNNSSAVTFAVDATSANTSSKVVARDGSGGFSAGQITASSLLSAGATSGLADVHFGPNVSDTSSLSFTNTSLVVASKGVDHTAARSNVMTLMRDGTSGVVYAGAARFDISRWQSDGVNARTQLTIALANTDTATLTDTLSLRSDGRVDVSGVFVSGSTVTGTQLISNIATGTAPLTVTSTTQVSNLNVQYLNGYSSDTANTANAIVRRDASGNFSAGTITATLSGNATSLSSFDTRSTNPNPDTYAPSIRFDFKENSINGLSDGGLYNGVMTWRKYGSTTDFSGGPMIQLGYTDNGSLWRRMSTSGTTWGAWAKFWHSANDGSGSGLDADLLDGLELHTGTNNQANKVVRTDANGYIQAGWINTISGDMADTTNIDRIYCSNDAYIRYKGVADFKQQIGLTYKQSTPRSSSTTDTNYWTGVMGFNTTDLNTAFDWGSGYIDSWSSPGNAPSGSTHWVGQQAMHYTNGANRYGWQMVVGEGNPSLTFIRGSWGASFTSWRRIWNDGNDGSGSGLDADLLDGLNAASTNTGSTIVSRDASGNFAAAKVDTTQVTRTNARVDTAERYPIGHYSQGEAAFELDPTWTNAELQNYFNFAGVSWVNDSTAPGGYAVSITGQPSVGGEYGAGFPYIPVDTNDIYYMECYIKNVTGTNTHYMGSIDYNEAFTSLGGNPGSFGYWVMVNTNPGTAWTKVSGYITGFGAATGQFKTGTKYWTPMALFNYTSTSGASAVSYISGWKVIRVSQYGNRTITGNLTASGTVTANSDIKLKANITPIQNALEKLTQIRGVEYDRVDRDNERQIGVIAQEVEAVIPELVSDNFGTKAVAYGNMTAVLIEAIKEQQIMINNLKSEIEELKKK